MSLMLSNFGVFMKYTLSGIIACIALATSAQATTITTGFNTSDGFITGDTSPVSVDFVTFSGGQQQQMFDPASYAQGPAGYLFVNGGPGFIGGGAANNTAASTGDTGLIDFAGAGVSDVSFFAANRGFGAATTLTVFGSDDTTVLGTLLVTSNNNNASLTGTADTAPQFAGRTLTTPQLISLAASDFGGAVIGSILVDLPGPAGRPPYVLAIDNFFASAVPLPGAAIFLLTGLAGAAAARRRAKK